MVVRNLEINLDVDEDEYLVLDETSEQFREAAQHVDRPDSRTEISQDGRLAVLVAFCVPDPQHRSGVSVDDSRGCGARRRYTAASVRRRSVTRCIGVLSRVSTGSRARMTGIRRPARQRTTRSFVPARRRGRPTMSEAVG